VTVHELKVWPVYFDALRTRRKTFEVRRNDRNYQLHDWLILREWNPSTAEYTGRVLRRRVSYISDLAIIGIDGFVAMGIKPLRGRA